MPKYLNGKTRDGNALVADQAYDLRWIDDFVRQIRPYVYVRESDRLLILIPNQAYRLNDSGAEMLKYLLAGHNVHDFLLQAGDDETKRRDIHYFFCDLRAIISGCLHDHEQRKAIDYYEFTGEFNKYPVLSEIAVTYRCNLHCDFCYVGDCSYEELSASDLKRILLKIYREANIPSVSFTGGEPLLRKDIVSLVSYASGIGLWTNLITNGTLLDDRLARTLKKAGLSSAQVSIEGACPELHDAITGVKGAFDLTINGIRALRGAGIPVHTNTTVSRHNINSVHDIIVLVRELGLSRLSMNLLIPCGTALSKKDIWVSYSEIGDKIMEWRHQAQDEGIKFLWYSPLPLCKFNPIAHGLGNKACAAITGLLSIDPAGNIIPCSSWRKPVGSLLKRNFRDIWESESLNLYKGAAYALPECRSCTQFAECKGACPLYWQACGIKELDGHT